MTYTIIPNAQMKSYEITFDCKPSAAVRDALKGLKFRWHSVKKVWYGRAALEEIQNAINTAAAQPDQEEAAQAPKKAEKKNKYGVQVGDIFSASWGYEQTNNNFFQVVALCGESSVRVREVYPTMIDSKAVSPMSEDRVYKLSREILPAADHSIFINDQEKGDIKRLKSFAADGVSDPQFHLTSYCNAYLCKGDTLKVYESWYA